MEIIKDPRICETLIKDYKKTILNSYGYKKILNDFYNPDEYLFFKNDLEVIPLVAKNNIVTFYGGMQHNHYNSLNVSKTFLNDVLSYLHQEKKVFQLLSLENDPYAMLNNNNSQFDVPYPAIWIYQNIVDYTMDNLLSTYNSKKRWQMKRVLRNQPSYTFEDMSFENFLNNYNLIIQLHNQYFKDRDLISVWENNEDLLLQLLKYFKENENIIIRTIKKENVLHAIYVIVYNNKELIYYFGTSLKSNDNYISKLMYFDMLDNANQIALRYNIDSFDALRGGFSNKKRFNFKPKALYALVHDQQWIVKRDSDLTEEEYKDVYKRNEVE